MGRAGWLDGCAHASRNFVVLTTLNYVLRVLPIYLQSHATMQMYATHSYVPLSLSGLSSRPNYPGHDARGHLHIAHAPV
jgi:hypothetical protein